MLSVYGTNQKFSRVCDHVDHLTGLGRVAMLIPFRANRRTCYVLDILTVVY